MTNNKSNLYIKNRYYYYNEKVLFCVKMSTQLLIDVEGP